MNSRNDDGWIWDLLLGVAAVVVVIVLGGIIVCRWLTLLLMQYVINPLLGGWLDRHDGAVVLLSTVIWAVLTMTLIYPLLLATEYLVIPPGQEQVAARIALTTGLVWGLVCGTLCVMELFKEMNNRAAADFTQTLEVPAEIYRYQGAANTPLLQTPELTAAEIDALFNPVPLALEGRTNGTHPQPVHG